LILVFLKKRGLVVGLLLALMFFGYQAYKNLALEAYPDIANLQVRVITQIPGKAAEEMERLITIPIEKELNGIPNSFPPRSITIFGLSVITVVFDDNVDVYRARQQVLEKISQADIPSDVRPQLDPNASPVGEIFRYTLESKTFSPMARKEWQDWLLERKFKSINGVVDVTGYGGPTKIYQVELDPDRLRALNLSQSQVTNAISSANGSTGGSFIIQNDQDYMVRGLGLLHSVEDIQNVVVSANKDGMPILVKDVGTIHVGPAVRKGQVGKNDDDDAVEGIVLMRRGENPSVAVEHLMDSWNDIQASLPEGMHMEPLYDRTALVRKTSETISHNVAEGIVLVVVILMLYLFQVRSALIAAVAIPVALCTAMILLNLFNIPANLLSLGAIDFGIIVDASIVMVENIVRHLTELREHGQTSPEDIFLSIYRAATEVAKPVLFATTIILLTFLPILTFESVEGKLFRPLAIIMCFQLIGAVIAAIVVVPVLCSIVFARKLPSERESPLMNLLVGIYEPVLAWAMRSKVMVAMIGIGAVAFAVFGFFQLGAEFLPELEEGNIWLRATVLPTSVSLDKSVRVAGEIRRLIRRDYPEVTNVVSQVGTPDDGTDPNNYSNIEFFIDLNPMEKWRAKFKTKQQLVNAMNDELTAYLPGVQYNFSQYIKDNMDEAIAGVKGELGIKVYGQDLDVLTTLGARIKEIVEKTPGIVDVAKDELLGQPQVLISIDRARAARYGINTNDVLSVVETSIGGKSITELIEGERRFSVVVRYQKNYRSDLSELENIQVVTPTGSRVPLVQLATITEGHGATSILRDRNQRRVAVKANIRGRDLVSAVREAQKNVNKSVKMPDGYHITWEGQFERAQHAMGRMAIIVPLTLALIFMLLYAAFGSATEAALVMLTVPLALPGAIALLWITHTHFSISAGIGAIALIGVSVQNGVILVSLVQQLHQQGIRLSDAVTQSALIRMKPALMTTTVAVAGLIPAALSNGIGAQSQKPLAIVIVGGLIPGVMLALLVLPAMYEFFYYGFRLKPKRKMSESSSSDSHIQHSTPHEHTHDDH
jgi:cobalt-zinc-cadmium resistance protein CzcA